MLIILLFGKHSIVYFIIHSMLNPVITYLANGN